MRPKVPIGELVRRLDAQRVSQRYDAWNAAVGQADPFAIELSPLTEVTNEAYGELSDRLEPGATTIRLKRQTERPDPWPERGFATIGEELIYYPSVVKEGPGLRNIITQQLIGTNKQLNFTLSDSLVDGGVYVRPEDASAAPDLLTSGERVTAYGRIIIEDASDLSSTGEPLSKKLWFKVSETGKWLFQPLGRSFVSPRPNVGNFVLDTGRGVVTVPPFIEPWAYAGKTRNTNPVSLTLGKTIQTDRNYSCFITNGDGFKDYAETVGSPGPLLANGTMLRHDGYFIDRSNETVYVTNLRSMSAYQAGELPDLESAEILQPNPDFRATVSATSGGWALENLRGLPVTGQAIAYVHNPSYPTYRNALWIGTVSFLDDGTAIFENPSLAESRPDDFLPVFADGSEAIFYRSTKGVSLHPDAPSELDGVKLEMWCELASRVDDDQPAEYELVEEREPTRSNVVFGIDRESVHSLPHGLIVSNGIVGNINDDGMLNGVVEFGSKLTMTGKLLLSLAPKYAIRLPRNLRSTDPVDASDPMSPSIEEERPELVGDGIARRIFDYVSARDGIQELIFRIQIDPPENGAAQYYDLPCHAFIPDSTGNTGGIIVFSEAVDPTLPYHFRGQTIYAYQFINKSTGLAADLGTDTAGLFLDPSADDSIRFNELIEDESNAFDWTTEYHFAIRGDVNSQAEKEYAVPFAIYGLADVEVFDKAVPAGYIVPKSGWRIEATDGLLIVPPIRGATIIDSARIQTLRLGRQRRTNPPANRLYTTAMTGCVRGVNGRILAHQEGSQISGNIVAQHHISLSDAVMELERTLGTDSSDDRRSIEWMLTALDDIEFELDETEGIHASFGMLNPSAVNGGTRFDVKLETAGAIREIEVVYDQDYRENIPGPASSGQSGNTGDQQINTLQHVFGRFDPAEPVVYIKGDKTELVITTPIRSTSELPGPSIFAESSATTLPDGAIDGLSQPAPDWIRLPEGQLGIEVEIPGVGGQSIKLPAWADFSSPVQSSTDISGQLSPATSPPIYDSEVFEVDANNRSARQFRLETKAVNYDDAKYIVYLRGLRLETYQFEISTDDSGGYLELKLPEDELAIGDKITVESVRLSLSNDDLEAGFDDPTGLLSGSLGNQAKKQLLEEIGESFVGLGADVSEALGIARDREPSTKREFIPGAFQWGEDDGDREVNYVPPPPKRRISQHSPDIPSPSIDELGNSAPPLDDRISIRERLSGDVYAADTWPSGQPNTLPSGPGPSDEVVPTKPGYQNRGGVTTTPTEPPDGEAPGDPSFPELPTL